MVYGGSQYWHSWTGSAENTECDCVLELGIQPNTLVKPPTLLTLLLESKAPTPCPSDILLRRETVQNVGGFEESFLGPYQLFEDQAFLSKVYLQTPVFVSASVGIAIGSMPIHARFRCQYGAAKIQCWAVFLSLVGRILVTRASRISASGRRFGKTLAL